MSTMTVVLFVAGLGLLVLGAEWLVKGASRLAAALGISPLVIGLTVVAYGTSAPEMAVSVKSAWAGQPDLAIGNVVGSNIFNVLFILGASAIDRAAPRVLPAHPPRRPDHDRPLGADPRSSPGTARSAGSTGRSSSPAPSPTRSFQVRQSRKESAAIRDEYAQEFGPRRLLDARRTSPSSPPGSPSWSSARAGW